jgi:hypothetical protein
MKLVQQPTLRSQAHLQVASANARPKPAKELAYPNPRQAENAAKLGQRETNDKNGQLVTRVKSKRADSGNLKGIASNKIYRSLTVLCFEMPASS